MHIQNLKNQQLSRFRLFKCWILNIILWFADNRDYTYNLLSKKFYLGPYYINKASTTGILLLSLLSFRIIISIELNVKEKKSFSFFISVYRVNFNYAIMSPWFVLYILFVFLFCVDETYSSCVSNGMVFCGRWQQSQSVATQPSERCCWCRINDVTYLVTSILTMGKVYRSGDETL